MILNGFSIKIDKKMIDNIYIWMVYCILNIVIVRIDEKCINYSILNIVIIRIDRKCIKYYILSCFE